MTWGIAARGRAAGEADSEKTLFEAAVEYGLRVSYAKGGRAAPTMIRSGKLASDPVAGRITLLPPYGALGEVVDVGLRAIQPRGAPARSGERDAGDRVRLGRREGRRRARSGARGLTAAFDGGDMRTVTVPPCDTVLFVDVLHYLTDAEQDAVLARAADTARTRVVVRELDPARGWRSRVTRAQERITTSLGYNRGARVNVRRIEDLAAPLRARGFAVIVEPCWGATPFSNVVLVAERPPRP